MEWLWAVVVGFAIVGVVLALRERSTGRGAIIDERLDDTTQTEADREAIRAHDSAINRSMSPPDHQ